MTGALVGNLGDHWEYRFNAAGYGSTTTDKYVIGAAGFTGIIGAGNSNFNGGTGGATSGGLDYGIVGADYIFANANGGVQGAEPYEKTSVTFTLSGLPDGFDPSTAILDARFAYGTAPDSLLTSGGCTDCGQVPEPATLALFGSGLLGVGVLRRRRKRT